MTSDDCIDLDAWTPAGRRTVDYAIDLLRSLHLPEVRGAEASLLANPDEATPALITALGTPPAQPSAVLLGAIGRPESIGPLLAAHRTGSEGRRAAVERGLALHPSAEAA
ncbi:MAG: hypothetical protein ACRDTH_25785 [Pseudonocardiaceae bacterium]